MGGTFSNTDAAICGIIALVEVILVISYTVTSTIRLRNKIISMGRLIPTIQMLMVGGAFPTQVVQVCHTTTYPPTHVVQVCDTTVHPPSTHAEPSPPGFRQPYDLPPPYSATEPKF